MGENVESVERSETKIIKNFERTTIEFWRRIMEEYSIVFYFSHNLRGYTFHNLKF